MKVDEEAYDFLRIAISKINVSLDPNRVDNYQVRNLVLSRLALENLYEAIIHVMDQTTKEWPQE